MKELACSGKDCQLRMRCSLYDNFIYYSMICKNIDYITPCYDEDMDYCEYFILEND